MAGKGDARRPTLVPERDVEQTFKQIFPTPEPYCAVCGFRIAWCECPKEKPKPRGRPAAPKEVRESYTLDRGDGRIERVCGHGVGHPTPACVRELGSWAGVHGCDGCCGHPTFFRAEEW